MPETPRIQWMFDFELICGPLLVKCVESAMLFYSHFPTNSWLVVLLCYVPWLKSSFLSQYPYEGSSCCYLTSERWANLLRPHCCLSLRWWVAHPKWQAFKQIMWHCGSSKVTQQVKMLCTKSHDLILAPIDHFGFPDCF